MENFNFIQLDPRKKKEEQPVVDLGIEDTIGVAKTNIDHHGTSDTAETPSACEQVLSMETLPENIQTIATVKTDADSVTAMAILASKKEGRKVNPNLVNLIGSMDRKGPQSLGEKWSLDKLVSGAVDERSEDEKKVVAITRLVSDFRKQLLEKIQFVQKLLEDDASETLNTEVKKLVAERDKDFVDAVKASKINVAIPGKLVVVESAHRFATSIGYEYAPTVIAFNPKMPVTQKNAETGKFEPTGETYAKFTVCRYDSNVQTDLASALKEIQTKEEGWGGRGDIFGSPQNKSSVLTVEQITEIISKYVK